MPETQNAVREGFRRLRREVLVLGIVLAALTLATGWYADYRSCVRQGPIRRFEQALNPQLAANVKSHELDCFRLLPED